MADNKFFSDPEPVKPEAPEPQPITIGEKQYTQDDLTKLVGLGERAAEIEKNYGSFDKFVSESGRRADEIGKYKKQLQEIELQKQAEEEARKSAPPTLTPEQIEQARRQLTELLGGEPITQANFTKMYVNMRQGEKLIEECDDLAGEINGQDGRPKFDRDEIITYMAETGIKKPLLAYKDKYENEIKQWEAGQLAKESKKMATMEPAGVAEVRQPKTTKDNLAQMISESLYGPQTE